MELNLETQKIERSTDFEEEFFGMGDLAVVMTILRSKLYSNPVRTIVQEILSNARDAHREVNKAEVPVQVTLPSTFNPTFEVKDFGPGISPQRMSDVFLLYGNSTKRADNTQTGGFGLGAKSPFSYTDTFIIETITEDVKRIYVAYIDESQIGKLSLLSTENVSEGNGTTIKIPVKAEDFTEYINNFYSVAAYWDVRPTVADMDLYPSVENYLQKLSRVWFEDHNGLKILLDKIPYYISQRQIQDIDVNKYATSEKKELRLLDIGVCIEFVSGELTVSANREQIELSENNLKKIFNYLQQAWEHLTEQLQKEVDLQEDYFAAVNYIRNNSSRYQMCVQKKYKDFSFKEKKIPVQLKYQSNHLPLNPHFHFKVYYFSPYKTINFRVSNLFRECVITENIQFIVVDDKSHLLTKLKQLQKETKKYLFVLTPVFTEKAEKSFTDSRKQQLIQKGLNTFFDFYGGIEIYSILKSSELKYTAPSRKNTVEKTKRKFIHPAYISGYTGLIKGVYLSYEKIEQEVLNNSKYKVFYLPTRNSWIICGKNEYSLREFKKDILELIREVFDEKQVKIAIFTCSETTYNKKYCSENIHGDLFSFIREGLYKKYPKFLVDELKYSNHLVGSRVFSLPVGSFREPFMRLNTIQNLKVKLMFKILFERDTWWDGDIAYLIRRYQQILVPKEELSPFMNFVLRTYKKYPLLKIAFKGVNNCSYSLDRKEYITFISDYINTVDLAATVKNKNLRGGF